MSAEQGEMVKFRNVTKQPVTFPCGSDRKQFGSVVVHEAGVPVVRPLFRQVERVITVKPGEVVLLENCRVNKGEKKNNEELAQKMAKLCDIYVNDAFGTAHRAEATTHGIAKFAPVACAGILMGAEIDALTKALGNPKRPLVAIVGGSKVSSKLTILKSLASKVDQLIVGGGIANTFLLASGKRIGDSLAEADLVKEAHAIMDIMKERGAEVPLPVDVVVADEARTPYGFLITPANQKPMVANAYWSLLRVPTMAQNEALMTQINLSYAAEPVRYAT